MVSPVAAATAAAVAADRHKKFYLCAAPRPPDFDELTENVIGGFGSLHKAEQVLEKTLDRIQNQHQWQRKSGPGRKSNAEHAIHFYEHVLEELRSRMAAVKEEEKKEEGTDDNNKEEDDYNIEEEEGEKESVKVEDEEKEEKKPAEKEDEQSSQGTLEKEHEEEEKHSPSSANKSESTSNTLKENRSDQCNGK